MKWQAVLRRGHFSLKALSDGDVPMSIPTILRERYRDVLRRSREQNSKDTIGNRYPWQAKCAIQELLQFAIKEQEETCKVEPASPICIRILTGSLPNDVFGVSLADSVNSFLRIGGRIKVLVLGDLSKCGTEFRRIRDMHPDKIELLVVEPDVCDDRLPHFLVVGEQAYRLEAPHAPIDPAKLTDVYPDVPARICFNDPSGATRLSKAFDVFWEGRSSSRRATVK